MAKFLLTLSFIFSLFLFSHARIQSNLPDGSVPQTVSLSTSLENDPKKSLLLLPSEKPDADNQESDTISAIGISRPLMTSFDVRFRPINRHFPHLHDQRPFPFRFPHRCRHHHHRHPRIQIPYGNDMIRGNVRQIPYGDDMIGGNVRQIPARGFGFRGERRPLRMESMKVKDAWLTDAEYKMPRHVDGEHEEREGSGFMNWLRDIVNRF